MPNLCTTPGRLRCPGHPSFVTKHIKKHGFHRVLDYSYFELALRQLRKDPAASFFHVFPAVEGRQAEVAFAGCTETSAGGADDVAFVQQRVEKAPAIRACWRLDPGVGRVGRAVDRHAGILQRVFDDAGVF